MPTYDYKCTTCEYLFEAEQRMSDPVLTDCPQCHTGKVRRLITGGAGISFKGSGFYANDSKTSKEKPKPEQRTTCPSGNCPSKK